MQSSMQFKQSYQVSSLMWLFGMNLWLFFCLTVVLHHMILHLLLVVFLNLCVVTLCLFVVILSLFAVLHLFSIFWHPLLLHPC